LNILIVLKSLRCDGGVETTVAALSNGLSELGHTVHIAAFCSDGGNELRHRFNIPENCFLYLGEMKGVCSQIRLVFRLRKILSEKSIDIVHTHLFHSGLIGRLAATFTRVQTVATEHSTFFHWWGARHYFVDRFLARRTGALTAVSPSTAGTLASRTGIYPNEIDVIPNMVDIGHFHPIVSEVRNDKRILMAGRFEYPKNHAYALEILVELRKIDPEFTMIMYGKGSLKATIEKKILDLGLEEAVQLLPPTKDFVSQLRSAGLFLLPSYWEGFPVVLLEAYATKTPVVAANVPGIIDLVQDQQTGCLIEHKDPVNAAATILKLQRAPSERQRLAENGYASLARYEQSRVVETFVRLYEKLLSSA
jgi:glycosyltransferase involved in cell wall biosynthesis